MGAGSPREVALTQTVINDVRKSMSKPDRSIFDTAVAHLHKTRLDAKWKEFLKQQFAGDVSFEDMAKRSQQKFSELYS